VNGRLRVLDAGFGEPALVVDYIALAWLKDDIDGVLPDDRRKRPGRRADQIAHGENGNPDPSIDRRTDFRVTEINFRLVELRLRRQHTGLRCRFVGRALVDRGLRDVLPADQLLAAPQLQSCVDLGCLCLG